MSSHSHDPAEDDRLDRGLEFDLTTLMHRRRALALLGGLGLTALAGCTAAGSSTGSSSRTGSSSGTESSSAPSSGATATTDVEEIPQETAGPYPGDGSNGPDALSQSGIVRRDIRSSFGSSTTTAEGLPLTIELTLLDAASDTPLPGAAVYLWHCNRDGEYSMYGKGIEQENYLRGVQAAGTDGKVTFTSIFPAAYSGRWPHIHFEVYSGLDDANADGKIKATSQLALPKDVCTSVYATSGYEQSVRNLSRTSLDSDTVFGDDGGEHQLATMTGSVDSGLTAALVVGV